MKMTIHRNKISRLYYRMNYLDLLPDDLIEIINKKLIQLQNKEKRKIRKETKEQLNNSNFVKSY